MMDTLERATLRHTAHTALHWTTASMPLASKITCSVSSARWAIALLPVTHALECLMIVSRVPGVELHGA
jgi:hypothetical protein